ncbi:EAL domain-containing protein [Vibrio harveyi]|nr:EAL domain-containing protein [Vibrio harveyi]
MILVKQSTVDVGTEDFQLHVNVSVHQLSSPNFVESVAKVLRTTGLPATNVTLEITESRIIDSAPTTLDNLLKLREMGLGIAIDDFGTGYSSLAYLHALPFTCLKIDRTFINRLTKENLDSSVVSAIINITKGMKTNVGSRRRGNGCASTTAQFTWL